MICVIDYDAGNINSVVKALEYLGCEVCVTGKKEELLSADHVILPGVGSFGDAMERLNCAGLVPVIREIVQKQIPFLGICLGMQVMFSSSEEAPGVEGLKLLPGRVLRFPAESGLKIPHIGWNSLQLIRESRLFKGIPEGSFVYFVHSYYLEQTPEAGICALSEYGINFGSAVEKDMLFGCQFHPEKSSETGLNILRNFIKIK